MRQRHFYFYIFLITGFLFLESASGQILFDTTAKANELVDLFVQGQGVRTGNALYKGPPGTIAFFTDETGMLGIDKGILLSTGSVFNASGPNSSPFITTRFTSVNEKRKKGDRDLNRICRNITWDVSILEFDFIPFHNYISFSYVFGSDEYPEYVDSRFNDVFAFLVDGEKLRNYNMALIPRTVMPVSINTVNSKTNPGFFIDNDYFKKVELRKQLPGTKPKKKNPNQFNEQYLIDKKKKKKLNPVQVNSIQYDGFTTVLTAGTYVVPFRKYHMKIAIGDVADPQYDSGVFLEAGSFNSRRDEAQPRFKEYADLSSKMNFDSIFGQSRPALISKKDSIANEEYEYFQLTNVNFESDSYSIPDTSRDELLKLADYLHRNKQFNCSFYGYTDNVGSKKYNQRLSENRANAVMDFLVSKGVVRERMSIAGYNFENPIADNSNEFGRAMNRRVEIVLIEE